MAKFAESFEAAGEPGATGDDKDPGEVLDKMVRAYRKEHPKASYTDAVEVILGDNDELRAAYGKKQ